MTFDLWPADSEFELDLYFSVIYLHIENIQNPSKIFEVIVRKPIRGTDGRTGATHNAPSRLRLRGHKKTIQNIWDNRMINARRPCDGRKWLQECPILNVGIVTQMPHIRRKWSRGCLRPMTDIFAITCGQRKIFVGSIASIARMSYVYLR